VSGIQGPRLCEIAWLFGVLYYASASPHSISSAKAESCIQADSGQRVETFGAEHIDGSKKCEVAEPGCHTLVDRVRFEFGLPRVATRLSREHALKIVAIGSSSTFGDGATSQSASYPSRFGSELGRRFPEAEITVLNRGVSGQELSQMIARFEKDVIAENPDLVLWQVGTNFVLRDRPPDTRGTSLHQGIARLKAAGAEVVLIDPQYAPKVIVKPGVEKMLTLLAEVARTEHVNLFHRYLMMQRWYVSDKLPFRAFVSPDGLHMNDWSYSCLAQALALAISDAAIGAAETP
jgi:acyl-CoA thioesterase-1